ncbi:MAG: SpoIIIAH-like family protein [Clostridia bacterium]|nr:SpoIIIAH-like family protein [Clostridia bacterium]
MKNIFKSRFLSRVGRRNIIIVAVVLLLGLAVYVNYRWFYQPVQTVDYSESDMSASLAAADAAANRDYFASADLSRRQSRDQALEVLQAAVDNPAEDTDVSGTLAQISRIAADMENESAIETLVLAKGFDKCVAVINGDKAAVIVNAPEEGLLPTQIAQISTIVYEQAGILPANVTIIQK